MFNIIRTSTLIVVILNKKLQEKGSGMRNETQKDEKSEFGK